MREKMVVNEYWEVEGLLRLENGFRRTRRVKWNTQAWKRCFKKRVGTKAVQHLISLWFVSHRSIKKGTWEICKHLLQEKNDVPFLLTNFNWSISFVLVPSPLQHLYTLQNMLSTIWLLVLQIKPKIISTGVSVNCASTFCPTRFWKSKTLCA